MPCKGFIHPLTLDNVPFDYFDTDTSLNGRPAFPPWAARFIAAKFENDVRHSTLDLTCTRCTGCPRQTFIEVLLPWWTDPSSSFVMHRGSALHEVAANNWNPATHRSEGVERATMTVAGKLFGTELSALMDCNTIAGQRITELIDLKFPNDMSIRFRGNTAKPDHAFQLNVARLLLAQNEQAVADGYDPDDVLLTIWDHACGKDAGPVPLPAAHMSEDQMLALTPGGGEWSVRNIIASVLGAKEVYDEREHTDKLKEGSLRELIAGMALVGRTQFNSKKCPLYCGVNGICDGIDMEFAR